MAQFYLALQGHQVDHHHTPHHRAHRHGPDGMGGGEGVVLHGDAVNAAGEGWGAGAPSGGGEATQAVADATTNSTWW